MKIYKLCCCALLVIVFFTACKSNELPTTTVPTTLEPTQTIQSTTTQKATEVETTKPVTTTEPTTKKVKYGDSKLTLDTDNPFVDAVVEKYGIPREGLICVYSLDGREGNYVWEFNGSKDANGNLIRNASTLKYVYAVSPDYKTVSRTGGYTGNDGCSKKDGLTVFLLTQRVLLPNLQDQIQ